MPGTTPTTHRIGWAIKEAAIHNRAVTRRGWKAKGQRITYVSDTVGYEGYLLLTTQSGRKWPVTLGHRDLLATDWMYAA